MTTTPAPTITTEILTGFQTGPFGTGWTYASPEDVVVLLEIDGVEQPPLTPVADYTLTSADPLAAGGVIALSPAIVPPSGWLGDDRTRLIKRRRTARRQAIALPDTEGHKPRATERGFDKAMRIAEEDRDHLSRALLMPFGFGGAVAWTPAHGERFLTLDAAGRPSTAVRPDDFDGLFKLSLDGGNANPAMNAALRSAIGADQAANVLFNLGVTGSVASDLAQRARERISVKADFGAEGNNFDDDTAAINAAIAWCNTQVFPVDLHFPRGFYKVTSALTPITGPTRIVGSGPRNTVLVFSGAYDCITFAGDASGWIGHCGILDIGLFCSLMTSGRTIVADNAIGGEIRNVLCDAPFNFAHLQQASNWTVSLVDAQPVRGEYGIKWMGTNTTRNGRIDKSDVLTLRDVTLHGENVGGSGSTADALWLEGYVHTLVISNVRLLAMKRGLLATNQSGVPANLVPSFALGAGLEIENPYHEAIRLEAMTGLWVNGLFCVGSTSECGIHIGPEARQVHLHGGRVAGNFTDGIYSEGNNVSLTGIDVYNNSRFASDAFSGVRCAGGSTFLIGQCVIGKPDGEPAYTERQKFGIANVSDATLKMAVVASDLTGNVSGATNGAISVTGCFTA